MPHNAQLFFYHTSPNTCLFNYNLPSIRLISSVVDSTNDSGIGVNLIIEKLSVRLNTKVCIVYRIKLYIYILTDMAATIFYHIFCRVRQIYELRYLWMYRASFFSFSFLSPLFQSQYVCENWLKLVFEDLFDAVRLQPRLLHVPSSSQITHR